MRTNSEDLLCTINSRKHDGSIGRSWSARLIETDGNLLVFEGVFESEVIHADLGIIRRGTISLEYYWLDRFYNVFRFSEPEGNLKCYYCNVNLPPEFKSNALDYVDLDIDVLWKPGDDPRILDLDEFETNAERFSYPEDTLLKAHQAKNEILELIERLEFPFSGL